MSAAMPFARDLCRRLVLKAIGASPLAPSLRLFGRGLLSIFTLHRFADPELGVTGHDPVALRGHLAYLRRHGYRLVSLADVLRRVEEGDDGSAAPAVAFTVDDGYADFARIAAPIFAEYDCPVTLFVTTGFVDGRLWMWWDRVTYLFRHTRRGSVSLALGPEERSYRWSTPRECDVARRDVLARLEWMDGPKRDALIVNLAEQLDVGVPVSPPAAFAPITWDELRRTATRGATFGPHTVTHRILSLAPDDACRSEVEESYRRLRQETDACVPVFCFPNGETRAFGRRDLEIVQGARLRAALTTVPDYIPSRVPAHSTAGRFALPRFPYPGDRPHVVHVVAGLARLKGWLRHGRNGVVGLAPTPNVTERPMSRTAANESRLTETDFWDSLYAPEAVAEAPRPPSRAKALLRRMVGPTLRNLVRDYRAHLVWNVLYPKYLPRGAGVKVLEVGSAPGTHLVDLHEAYGFECYGVEYTPRGVALNRQVFKRHGLDPANVIYADFFDPDFQARYRGFFDIVMSRGFIEHFRDVEPVVSAHVSVLATGGLLLVSIPNFRGLNYWLASLFCKDRLPLHNLAIMTRERFASLFDAQALRPLYCGYFGGINLNVVGVNETDGFRRLVLAACAKLQLGVNLILRTLFRRGGAEHRWLSPHLVFVGHKTS